MWLWRVDKSMCTFRRLMNCTHSTQEVRKGSKHTAHLPNRESIVCISGRSKEALDTMGDIFNCSFRMNLAACSCAENSYQLLLSVIELTCLIPIFSSLLLQFHLWLLPPVSSHLFHYVSLTSLNNPWLNCVLDLHSSPNHIKYIQVLTSACQVCLQQHGLRPCFVEQHS